jgi:hypothetical protein
VSGGGSQVEPAHIFGDVMSAESRIAEQRLNTRVGIHPDLLLTISHLPAAARLGKSRESASVLHVSRVGLEIERPRSKRSHADNGTSKPSTFGRPTRSIDVRDTETQRHVETSRSPNEDPSELDRTNTQSWDWHSVHMGSCHPTGCADETMCQRSREAACTRASRARPSFARKAYSMAIFMSSRYGSAKGSRGTFARSDCDCFDRMCTKPQIRRQTSVHAGEAACRM